MKFFKKKNLLNVLYAVLIALPLFSILGRVLYTQWNQNAKDSYYGETINEKTETQLTSINNLNSGEYKFNNNLIPISNSEGSFNLFVSDFQSDTLSSYIDTNRIRMYSYPSGENPTIMYIAFYDTDTLLGSRQLNTQSVEFTFYLESYNYNNQAYLPFSSSLYKIEYNKYSYLDSAFDYSISRFVNENDFGKLNFFTWFSDLFLSNNSLNNLYIHFVNWYLNYTLYVSLGYILWLVLMWFVSFIRRLLEKTSTYETGGF